MLIPTLGGEFYPEAAGFVRSSQEATREQMRRKPEVALALLRQWPLTHDDCREIRKVFPAVSFEEEEMVRERHERETD